VNFTHNGWSYGKVNKGWQKHIEMTFFFLTRKYSGNESVFISKFYMELRIRTRTKLLASSVLEIATKLGEFS
jgi:hypothetical protein